jgi:hypothetical protein
MNPSQPHKERTDKRWLSQLLADSAFPLLALAIAVSQVKIGQQKKDALRQRGRQSSVVQVGDDFQKSAGKRGPRAAMGNSPVEERTGSEKESAHDQ